MKPTGNTMSTAFETRPLVAQSFMQRLLRQHPTENAVIELNNLLATHSIQSITPTDVAAIEQRYGLSLSQFMLNLEEFYAVHLNYQLANQPLPGNGLADLAHLQDLFQLPAQSVEMLHIRIGEVAYRQRAERAVRDGQISADDKATLTGLQKAISLPSDLADTIYTEVCQAHLDQFVHAFGTDARITPDEEQRLQSISKNLGVKLSAEAKRTVERYKKYWTAEHTALPVIEVSTSLQKSEQCHYYAESVQWFEERASARRTNYDDHYEHGKSFDVVDLQSTTTSARKETFDILKRISSGNLYLTNKRLIFEGSEKTTSVKSAAIISVKAYKQGILIDKLTGRSMLLLIDRDADSLALMIQRLLRSTASL